MQFSQPVTDLIRRRFSCRSYVNSPIAMETRQRLSDSLLALTSGPLGSLARFQLLAAEETNAGALRGLGTYGFIKDAPGFIVGAVGVGAHSPEDFGFLMELAVLCATDLNLGTCWLGGSFTHSSFARKLALLPSENLPAVTAVGNISSERYWLGNFVRKQSGARGRYDWQQLFFDGDLGHPLNAASAGPYAEVVEMVPAGTFGFE